MTAQTELSRLNWAFSTLGCTEATLEEACALASKYRLASLEVRALEGRFDIPDYFAARYDDAARIREVLQTGGQEIVCFGTSFAMLGSGPPDRAALVAWAT